MRYYWVRDRHNLGQFYVYWDQGKNNLGDYYTKTHPPWHAHHMRPQVLNNPADTPYHSSKGVLVRPARPNRRPSSKPTGTRTLTAKSNITASIAVTNQAKRLSSYLEKIKQTSPSIQTTQTTH
jgi:hypothetical protein